MSKLPGQVIRRECPVAPIEERQRAYGMSYGLGPAGYDVRIAETTWVWPGRFVLASTIEYFQMPSDLLGTVHDKSTLIRCGVAMQNTVIEPGWRGYLTIEITKHGWRGRPRPVVQGHWVEDGLDKVALWESGDGLWARLGKRFLSHWPIFRLHAGMPIAQVLFDRLEEPAEQPYTGKYQDQAAGAQVAIFEG